jgi:DNA polymerase-3 subunit delta'
MLFEQEDRVAVYPKELWSDQLISQDIHWTKINSAITNGHYPHFSLLLGKPGNGQLVMALGVAQTLFCTSDEKPCGICDACYKVKNCIHPDLHFSFPLNKPKVTCQEYYSQWRLAISEKPFLSVTDWFEYLGDESKNANISVAEINNFSELLSLRPYESDKTVLILWLPEYLGKESNRLLKLFEEPPSNVFVILVSENSELLLPTVLSRAQLFRMQSIQLDEASKMLAMKYNVQADLAYAALLSSDRNIQEAIQQIEQQSMPSIEVLRKLLQSAYSYQVKTMIEWVESFQEMNKEEQKKFIEWIQLLLSFVLRIKYSGTTDMDFQGNPMMAYSKKLTGSLSLIQINQWVDLMDDCLIAIQRNANIKVLMTHFCIELSHIIRNEGRKVGR